VGCRQLDPTGDTESPEMFPVQPMDEGCRQLDPTGDTERSAICPAGDLKHLVADNSIRPGILKEAQGSHLSQGPGEVADNSIRPGILKGGLAGGGLILLTELQTTRSDRGY